MLSLSVPISESGVLVCAFSELSLRDILYIPRVYVLLMFLCFCSFHHSACSFPLIAVVQLLMLMIPLNWPSSTARMITMLKLWALISVEIQK